MQHSNFIGWTHYYLWTLLVISLSLGVEIESLEMLTPVAIRVANHRKRKAELALLLKAETVTSPVTYPVTPVMLPCYMPVTSVSTPRVQHFTSTIISDELFLVDEMAAYSTLWTITITITSKSYAISTAYSYFHNLESISDELMVVQQFYWIDVAWVGFIRKDYMNVFTFEQWTRMINSRKQSFESLHACSNGIIESDRRKFAMFINHFKTGRIKYQQLDLHSNQSSISSISSIRSNQR